MSQPQPDHRPTTGTPPSTPGWVKLFAVILIILVLVVVVLHLTGNSLGSLHGIRPSSPTLVAVGR